MQSATKYRPSPTSAPWFINGVLWWWPVKWLTDWHHHWHSTDVRYRSRRRQTEMRVIVILFFIGVAAELVRGEQRWQSIISPRWHGLTTRNVRRYLWQAVHQSSYDDTVLSFLSFLIGFSKLRGTVVELWPANFRCPDLQLTEWPLMWVGRLKMREWKMREQTAGVENIWSKPHE